MKNTASYIFSCMERMGAVCPETRPGAGFFKTGDFGEEKLGGGYGSKTRQKKVYLYRAIESRTHTVEKCGTYKEERKECGIYKEERGALEEEEEI